MWVLHHSAWTVRWHHAIHSWTRWQTPGKKSSAMLSKFTLIYSCYPHTAIDFGQGGHPGTANTLYYRCASTEWMLPLLHKLFHPVQSFDCSVSHTKIHTLILTHLLCTLPILYWINHLKVWFDMWCEVSIRACCEATGNCLHHRDNLWWEWHMVES